MIGIMSKRTHFTDSVLISRASPVTYSQAARPGCDKHITGVKPQYNNNIFFNGGRRRGPAKKQKVTMI
jgi:hypothetical protein